jgi:hypothetical protein
MKTIIFTLLMIPVSVTAQEYTFDDLPDSVVILKMTDDMTDKVYMFASKKIKAKEAGRSFELSVSFTEDLSVRAITVTEIERIGNCTENGSLLMLFENGEKITLSMYNGFNCKGMAFFSPSKKQMQTIKSIPLSKVRFTDGRSGQTCTHELTEDERTYFISLLRQAESKTSYTYKQ